MRSPPSLWKNETDAASADEEVKAVRVLHAALQNHPQSYSLLHVQCDFLRSKDKHDWALKLAKQAVNCAPSEFVTWAKLTEVNMELGRFSDVRSSLFLSSLVLANELTNGAQALLTLNSCPMFTYNERDLHRMPTPARSHLPMKDFIAASGILDDEVNSTHNNDADVALLRLPAPSLRGTFSKAYGLLAKLVSQIGWDELLKCRSQVFVMEEEYRMQKAQDPAAPTSPPTATNGFGGAKDVEPPAEGFGPLALEGDSADEDASIKGVHSETPGIAVENPSSEDVGEGSGSAGIPTIKVSTDSDGEREREAIAKYEDGGSDLGAEAPGVGRPETSVKGEEGGTTASAGVESEGGAQAPGSFSNKRLCERWLDNLFMVLYEVRFLFPFFSSSTADGFVTGSSRLHHLARRGRSLQGAAFAVPQDGNRVGDPRRARATTAP